MKVLVIGDLIIDSNTFGNAVRLCPEAPVPVVVPDSVKETRGGAGLVADQLKELIGEENVLEQFGSKSRKERIFANGHLICRVDFDSLEISHQSAFHRAILADFKKADLVVVSDYNKEAITEDLATEIMCCARAKNIPVFVDAKNTWENYKGAFAFFPNKYETKNWKNRPKHEIQKLGECGCLVDGVHISSQSEHTVRDTTGAGDVFLAAFVYHWLTGNQIKIAGQNFPLFYLPGTEERVRLEMAARFANKVAGISVEFVGTHIVTQKELLTN